MVITESDEQTKAGSEKKELKLTLLERILVSNFKLMKNQQLVFTVSSSNKNLEPPYIYF